MLAGPPCAKAPAFPPLTSTGSSQIQLLQAQPASFTDCCAWRDPKARAVACKDVRQAITEVCDCREDSFTAHNRTPAPLKAEDHRHLFAKPQRSASVPPAQRQMLDEYRETSLGVP